MEYIAKVIGEYAFFLDNYGNYVFIPLLVLVFISDWRLAKSKFDKAKKVVRPLFTFLAIALCTLVYLINFSFKPMVSSLSKVDGSIGTKMVHFDYMNVNNGNTESLEDYDEKIVLLNFWATYCPPCIQEFPDLKKLENEFSDDLVIIAVSDEEPDKIIRFISRVESPSIVGSQPNYQWINPEKFLPLTVIIDKGKVVDRFFGRRSYEEFVAIVNQVNATGN